MAIKNSLASACLDCDWKNTASLWLHLAQEKSMFSIQTCCEVLESPSLGTGVVLSPWESRIL